MPKSMALIGLLVLTASAPTLARAQEQTIETQVVDAMNQVFGSHPGFRAFHAKGIVVEGSFKGAPEAAALSRAVLFDGRTIPVTVRFSDSGGLPTIADGAEGANPHGMALKFHLPDGSETDMVTNSFKVFLVPTAADLRDFFLAIAASPPEALKPTKLDQFVASHPTVTAALSTIAAPDSFAHEEYHGLNAFVFVNKAGERQAVRYVLTPEQLVHLKANEAAQKPPNFLMDELPERLARGPVTFHLKAQLAAAGDPTNDPTRAWPEDRKVVDLGIVTLDKTVPDSAGAEKKLLFLPGQLTDGIEASDDPMIAVRDPACEKLEIIRLVERSHLPARRTLEKLGIPRATFHRWYDRFLAGGVDALEDRRPQPKRVWNRIPDAVRERIVDLALNRPELSPRELAVTFTDAESYFVSEASVYRLLKAHDLITSPAFIVIKAADEFRDKTTAPDQLWQTDFTYLKVIGWGWFYLSTVLDDFSRYIIAWKLCTTMKAQDVTDTLNLALEASGCDGARVRQRPRLLSDNGPCYVAADLADWLADRAIEHTRGAPCHPQTQGKIERWHQTLKNRILLENYFLPCDLEAQIAAFVENYNHRRYHESLDNLTPADVYFGRGQTILLQRERIKRKTIEHRRLQHRKAAA